MTAFTKRVVFTMGGKGGVGKTGVIVALAEWFAANEIPVTLLEMICSGTRVSQLRSK